MSFAFRLQSVLRYREFLEQAAQKELFEARAEQRRQQETIAALLHHRADAVQQCRECCRTGVTSDHYRVLKTYIDALDARLVRERKTLKVKTDAVAQRRSRLNQARIDKKILETLKDRNREKFRAAAEKMEQDRLDEMVLLRFGRQS
jgi:flagellar FliJ protein